MRLIEVFDELGLRRPGSTAIDVPQRCCAGQRRRTTRDRARAVGGVLSAAVALADPAVVLVGGPWGRHPADPRGDRATRSRRRPRHVPVEAAAVATSRRSPAPATRRWTALRDAVVAAAR